MEKEAFQNLGDNALFSNVELSNIDAERVEGELLVAEEGNFIYGSNSSEKALYLIINGEIALQLRNNTINIEEKEFFGETDFLNREIEHKALALEDSYLIKISKNSLNYLLETNQQIKENILSVEKKRADFYEDKGNPFTEEPEETTTEGNADILSDTEDDNLSNFTEEENYDELDNIVTEAEEKHKIKIDEDLILDELNKIKFSDKIYEDASEKYDTLEEVPVLTDETHYSSIDDLLLEEESPQENISSEEEDTKEKSLSENINIEKFLPRHYNLILKKASIIFSDLDLDILSYNVIKIAKEFTKSEEGALFFFDTPNDKFWSNTAIDSKEETSFDTDENVLQEVLQKKSHIIINNICKEEFYEKYYLLPETYKANSILYFPFYDEDENLIVVLQLVNNQDAKYSKDEIQLLDYFGKLFLPAIKNSVLNRKGTERESEKVLKNFCRFLNNEIKKPVLTAKTYAEYLSEEISSTKESNYLSMLKEQLSALEDKIISLTSLKLSEVPLRLVSTSTNYILDKFSHKLSAILEENNCKLVTDFDEDVQIKIDTKLFYQCFYNLITNSIEAMPQGGTIKVSTKKASNNIEIKIEDESEELPLSLYRKVFQPFFSYGKKEKAGLGLTLTKEIIEAHAGKIDLIKNAGKGLAFKIMLPTYVLY